MSFVVEIPTKPLEETLKWCLDQAQAPIVRPISQWMEDEIVLPSGPYAGESYRHSRHPVSRPWFAALESRQWSRFAASGPTQNGKTLMCYVGPVLYHLFEVGETVIVGLPSMDMANDKWTADFMPVIQASRYHDLLPLRGEGSRGGQVRRAIDFRNGTTLRFMTAGGSDKKRAGFTSRVLAVTETDGMDESGESSREADKIEQLEGRTRAFGRTGKRVYLECTVSIERGRIWQEIKNGTDSRIARPCPHCGIYVTPERENLLGWVDAKSEEEAADNAHWVCPSCDEKWTEQDRLSAAKMGVLVHRGQEVTVDGSVTGPVPRTQTLGLRWSAIDNPFVTAADLGAEEWLAARSKDRDNAEKKMRQFVWAIPYEPPEVDLTPLDYEAVVCRVTELRKGIVPPDCAGVAVGIDTGKRILHWEAKAARTNGSMPIIEYGTQTVEADKLGVYQGLLAALRELRKYLEGSSWKPSQVWIDSGYHEHTDAVYAFCAEANKGLAQGQERYRPSKGYGEGQVRTGRYIVPNHRTSDIIYVGKEFHIARVRRNGKLLPGVQLVHVNSDHWKSELHQRLAMPPTETGAVTIFKVADTVEHATWAAHQVAEKQVEKFLAGRGNVIVWERINRENHFLDAGYSATAGCQFILDIINKPKQTKPEDRPSPEDLIRKHSHAATTAT